MKEKWKARQEQLHMCECSLGAREPGGRGRGGMMARRGGFPPLLEKSLHSTTHQQSSGPRALGEKTQQTRCWKPASDQPAPVPCPPSAPPVPRPVSP